MPTSVPTDHLERLAREAGEHEARASLRRGVGVSAGVLTTLLVLSPLLAVASGVVVAGAVLGWRVAWAIGW